MTRSPIPPQRLVLRLVARDKYARVQEIAEQEIPATAHAVALFLRREPARVMVANALLAEGNITLELKGKP